MLIYNYKYRNWKYVSDPNDKEYFSKAFETINNDLSEDSDDFSILMATCIERIRGRARIVFAKSDKGVKVYV